MKLKEVDSLEEAEQLRGHTLCMLAEDRPELEGEDEFYVQELVGMQVLALTIPNDQDLVARIAIELLLMLQSPNKGVSCAPGHTRVKQGDCGHGDRRL